MTPGVLNLQEIEMYFNLKMLNFNMGFTMDINMGFEKITIQWIASIQVTASLLGLVALQSSSRYQDALALFGLA